MPPRYAYWTILVDNLPTAFRSSSQEELLPTFNRLKEKNPSAEMKWWQNGKLWDSRVDAQEAMIARGELGRKGDSRQAGGFRDRRPRPSFNAPRAEREERNASGKLDWTPKSHASAFAKATADKPGAKSQEKLDWKPKGSFTSQRPAKPDWKSRSRDDRPRRDGKPDWKPKGSFKTDRPARPEWKSKSSGDRPRQSAKPEWRSRSQAAAFAKPTAGKTGARSRAKLDWAPKADAPAAPREKRKWVPKEEYKKSLGIEAKRDKNWRPGGAHKDPRQKYKDAKKAKWGRFKEGLRKRWEGKQGAKPRKKKDGE